VKSAYLNVGFSAGIDFGHIPIIPFIRAYSLSNLSVVVSGSAWNQHLQPVFDREAGRN
jgi:hypothetical protein